MRELRLIELLNAVRKEAGLEALHMPCILLLRHGGWAERASSVGMVPDPPADASDPVVAPQLSNGAAAVPLGAAPWADAAPSGTDPSDGNTRPPSSTQVGGAAAMDQDSVDAQPPQTVEVAQRDVSMPAPAALQSPHF